MSRAPPVSCLSTSLRSWKASSSGRWPTLIKVASGIFSLRSFISLSWLSGSSAEVASSSTIRLGLWIDEAREGEALLLAARQRLLPGAFLVQAIEQMAEPDRFERLADLLVLHRVRRHRIGGGAAQRAERHVGLLRQHQQLGVALHHDLAFAPRPQPGDRAHQRALAGAGLADDQHLLAGRDVDLGLVARRRCRRRAVTDRPRSRSAGSSCCAARDRLMPPAFSAS